MIEFQKFPARVEMSDGRTYPKTGIVVADGIAYMGWLAGDVKTEHRRGVQSIERLGQRTVLHFDDGGTWTISKGAGCSCGSPLKRWYQSTASKVG